MEAKKVFDSAAEPLGVALHNPSSAVLDPCHVQEEPFQLFIEQNISSIFRRLLGLRDWMEKNMRSEKKDGGST